jgi:hypothetical protein
MKSFSKSLYFFVIIFLNFSLSLIVFNVNYLAFNFKLIELRKSRKLHMHISDSQSNRKINRKVSLNSSKKIINVNKNDDSNIKSNLNRPLEKAWSTGKIFTKVQKRRRNDPWWMREEESNNPRILPIYQPWWFNVSYVGSHNFLGDENFGNILVNETWKVADLKAEALRRGLNPASKKDLLIRQLQESSRLKDLSDEGFTSGKLVSSNSVTSDELFNKCYPNYYETKDQLNIFREKLSNLENNFTFKS